MQPTDEKKNRIIMNLSEPKPILCVVVVVHAIEIESKNYAIEIW